MMGWGSWQWPHGPLAWAALVSALLALSLLLEPVRAGLGRLLGRPWRAVLALALAAAVASAAYVPLILGSGPRIIDATAYWLQARVFASGHVAFATAGPASSFRGRFLLETVPGSFALIFPPGYPALLAPFQALGAPWLLGPLLSLGLCLLTARLAWLLAKPPERQRAMLVAAALSLLCGVARHHTAETMSHGLTMVAIAGGFVCILHESRWADACAGVCLGVVATTRFASALALGPVLLGLSISRAGVRSGALRVACVLLGALPLLAALLLYQRAVTGSPWITPQSLYYLRADAPLGCFRYGFGDGIGCDHEHGDFVRAHLSDHVYGAWDALRTSARRLRLHALDIANFEPLVVLGVLGAVRLRVRGRFWLVGYPACVVLAYAPFYFDGNYPGGGARFLTDALPLEHALVALAVARATPASVAAVVSAALGFAIHAAPEHAKLAARDGGMPMWTDRALSPPAALVLTNTDHGFDLGHGSPGTVVARLRGDANDTMLVAQQARGASARLAYFSIEPEPVASGFRFTDYVPPPAPWRFELENEWPARRVTGATAIPVDAAACSAQRALQVTPHSRTASVVTSLWLARAGTYQLTVHGSGSGARQVELTLAGRTVSFALPVACGAVDLGPFTLHEGDHDVMWELDAPIWLDAMVIDP